MVERAQQVEQIIKIIEDKVNAAKLERNRPEAARLQNMVNELQDYLKGNNGSKIPVDLSEFNFQFDMEEENESDAVENIKLLENLKEAFHREDYQTCIDLVSQFSKEDANIAQVIQYGENALFMQDVSTLVHEAEEYAEQKYWQEAIQILEKMNREVIHPEKPFQIVNTIREKAENLLFEYNKNYYEAKFEGDEKREAEDQGDVSDQNVSDDENSGRVQEEEEDKSLSVVGDVEFDDVNIIVDNYADREPKSDVERAEKIDQLMSEALIAEREGQLILAQDKLRELLKIDDRYHEALRLFSKLEMELIKRQTVQNKIDFEIQIENTEDVKKLEKLTLDLQTLCTQNSNDEDFHKLFQKANEKYLEKKKSQEETTTVQAINNYEMVREGIQFVNTAIRRGEETWADDRTKMIRPIYEVLDELEKELPKLAEEVCKRYLKKVNYFWQHDPKNAISYLLSAWELEALSQETKDTIEIKLKDAESRLLQWKKADEILSEARQIDDPYLKLLKIEEAQSEYEHHVLIQSYLKTASEIVSAILNGSINRAISEAEMHLVHNEFDIARECVNKALEKTDMVINKTNELIITIKEARKTLTKINKTEEDQKQVADHAKNISNQIKQGNYSFAKQIFDSLPPEWQADSRIDELRVFFEHLVSNEERIASAQTYFENGSWNACIAECKKIGEEGAIQEKIRFWRVTSQINLYKQQIYENWSKEMYLEAENVLQILFSMPELSVKQADELRAKYAVYLQMIEDYKINDPLITGKLSDAEKAKENNQLILAFDTYNELMKVNSTRKGFIRQEREVVEKILHDDLIKKLNSSLQKKDYGKAYEYAESMNHRHLFWGEEERKLREEAVRCYIEEITSEMAKANNWQEVIDEWEKAKGKFSSENAIDEKIRSAKRNKLIFDCERNLSKFNFTVVLGDIDESLIDLKCDPQLENIHRLAEMLKEAEAMIAGEEFTRFQNFLSKQENNFNDPIIQKYKEQKMKEIVINLVQSGDELIEKGDITKALNRYTTALNLEPQSITTLERVKNNSSGVRSEIENLRERVERFSPGLALVNEKQEEGAKIYEYLKRYLSVISYVDDSEGNFSRKLNNAISDITKKLDELKRAQEIIDRYKETSDTWKELLHSGNWLQLERELRDLGKLLNGQHPQYVEIYNRKQKVSKERNLLNESLDKFKNAFDEEKFDLAITEISKALQLNTQLQKEGNIDPFGLIAKKATVYDIYYKDDYSSLESLMQLVEDKKNDLDKWTRWFDKINAKAALLDNSWNDVESYWPKGNVYGFDITKPNKNAVESMAVCEKRHQEIIDVFEKEIPDSGPLSTKARLLKKQAADMKVKIVQSQEQLLMLKESYEESSSYVDFDELSKRVQDLIEDSAFDKAMRDIEIGLAYDSDNEMFKHWKVICQEYSNKHTGLLGRLRKQR